MSSESSQHDEEEWAESGRKAADQLKDLVASGATLSLQLTHPEGDWFGTWYSDINYQDLDQPLSNFIPLGLEVRNHGPIEIAFVPLEHEFTVLYGTNGAGKTYVLNAIAAGFGHRNANQLNSEQAVFDLHLQRPTEIPLFSRSLRSGSWDPYRDIANSVKEVVRNKIDATHHSDPELFPRLDPNKLWAVLTTKIAEHEFGTVAEGNNKRLRGNLAIALLGTNDLSSTELREFLIHAKLHKDSFVDELLSEYLSSVMRLAAETALDASALDDVMSSYNLDERKIPELTGQFQSFYDLTKEALQHGRLILRTTGMETSGAIAAAPEGEMTDAFHRELAANWGKNETLKAMLSDIDLGTHMLKTEADEFIEKYGDLTFEELSQLEEELPFQLSINGNQDLERTFKWGQKVMPKLASGWSPDIIWLDSFGHLERAFDRHDRDRARGKTDIPSWARLPVSSFHPMMSSGFAVLVEGQDAPLNSLDELRTKILAEWQSRRWSSLENVMAFSWTFNGETSKESELRIRNSGSEVVLPMVEDMEKAFAVKELWRTGKRPTTDASHVDSRPDLTEPFLRTDPSSHAVAIRQELIDFCDEIGSEATLIFNKLFPSKMKLVCQPTPVPEWSTNGPIQWFMKTGTSGEEADSDGLLPLESMSSAEYRWAKFSIQLADFLRTTPLTTGRVVLIDEPERALHRRAEYQLAESLYSLASEWGFRLVVASHSPSFLRPDRFNVLHVARDKKNRTVVHPLPSDTFTDFDARLKPLGLNATDVLQLHRAHLLVEGEHELVVLEELIGDELRRLGVGLLCMRGATHLKAWDAQLVERYTEAPFFVLVDNDDNERIRNVWESALDAAAKKQSYFSIIDKLKLGSNNKEGEFLRELCKNLIKGKSPERFNLLALTLADIPEYLPVECIAPKAAGKTWEVLRNEAGNKAESSGAFKKWMRETYEASYTNESLRDACRAMDEVPAEFVQLLDLIDESLNN